jgi:hypothetical protein
MRSDIKLKIGYFTKLSLRWRGKRDAHNRVVINEGEPPICSSPFFKHELSLCFARIVHEYEIYLQKKRTFLSAHNSRQVEIARLELEIIALKEQATASKEILDTLTADSVSLKNDVFDGPVEEKLLGEEELEPTIVKEFRIIEKRASLTVENERLRKQIQNQQVKRDQLTSEILALPIKKKKFQDLINSAKAIEAKEENELSIDNDIFIVKSQQYYTLALARLSEYWSGVLRGSNTGSSGSEFPPSFSTESLFHDIKKEIERLDELREEQSK